MDPSSENERAHPNHEAIPPEEVPAASPKLDAPPRATKRSVWGWLVLVIAVGFVALLGWWR